MYSLKHLGPDCVDDPPYNASYCGFSHHEGCLPLNGCGSVSAVPFMLSFIVLISVIFVSLYVAVVVEA